jgi:membrane-associated phospholipid phosphatase
VLLFFFGYFAVGLSTAPARAHEFATPLDRRIPFIARSIWIYLWSFSASLIPLFIVRCHSLFRRTSLAFALAIGASLICFSALPATALHLRANAEQLHPADPSRWAVSAIYSLDPPYNLFPSLHISITALAAMSVWKVNKRYGALLFVCLGLVAISVCTTKQHYLVDVLGGLALAALIGGIVIGPYRSSCAKTTYSWRGPAIYLASLALMYAGFYTAYLWSSPHAA